MWDVSHSQVVGENTSRATRLLGSAGHTSAAHSVISRDQQVCHCHGDRPWLAWTFKCCMHSCVMRSLRRRLAAAASNFGKAAGSRCREGSGVEWSLLAFQLCGQDCEEEFRTCQCIDRLPIALEFLSELNPRRLKKQSCTGGKCGR